MHHQCTELPPSKVKRKQKPFRSRQDTTGSIPMKKNKECHKHTRKMKIIKAHASHERCTNHGDSQHIEGFRCPASKHQGRNCHRYGHFSILCYKKREVFDKKRSLESRSPKAYQLQIGLVYIQDSLCGQSEDLSSSKDAFCLQIQLQNTQVETKIPAPQHLITILP